MHENGTTTGSGPAPLLSAFGLGICVQVLVHVVALGHLHFGAFELPWHSYVLALALAHFSYCFDRLWGALTRADVQSHPARVQTIERHASSLAFVLIADVVFCAALSRARPWIGPGVLALLSMTAVYPLYLKRIALMKAVFVGAGWAAGAVILPIAAAEGGFAVLDDPLVWVIAFIAGFAGSSLMDVPDLDADRAAGTVTLATLLGPTRTRLLCYGLCATAGLLCLVHSKTFVSIPLAIAYIAGPPLMRFDRLARSVAGAKTGGDA
jgi:4-hydroxybenzoate polyprenyltransferase